MDPASRPARTGPSIALGALAALAAVAAYTIGCRERAVETMPVRTVHHELLFGHVPMAVEGPDGALAEPGVLTPAYGHSGDASVETGDMPALVLPPPGRAFFVVPEETGEVRLRASTGVDVSVTGPDFLPADGDVEAGFRVLVNGAVRHEETRVLRRTQDVSARAWRAVGGPEGLLLQPGDEVVLETSVVNGTPLAPPRLGFGPLVLERFEELPRERASSERPNILFIVMDTLRADRLGLHGHARDTSPVVDALAARGTAYTFAYATSSWTWPSTASLLTGLRPEAHGVTSNHSCYLAGELDTLPEALQRSGYTTAAISGNPLIVPRQNFDQGFEHFDHATRFRKSDVLVPQAVEWLEANRERRFFLYLHLTDTHTPHLPRAEDLERFGAVEPADFPHFEDPSAQDADGFEKYAQRLLKGEGRGPNGEPRPGDVIPEDHARWMQDCYDACVRTGDFWVGELLAALERLELDENTLVVFTSDHGEELLDHGLLAHGHTLHAELVRAPLVLAGPGVASGVRSETPVSNRLLAGTLALAAGTRLGNATRDLRNPDALPYEAPSFSTEKGWWNGRKGQKLYGLRARDWTLHHAPTGAPWGAEEPVEGGETRLYAMHEGVGLEIPLPDGVQEPDVVEVLLEELAARHEVAEAIRPRVRLAAGENLTKQLTGMGYIDSGDDEDETSDDDGANREDADR